MTFLFDTNALIAIMKSHPGVLGRLKRHDPKDFGVSSIVEHELFYGAYKALRVAENLRRIEALQFEILNFERDDARRAGEIRAQLAKAGTPIGPYDILIAGQALARGLILITRNTREFERIPLLRFENWEIDAA